VRIIAGALGGRVFASSGKKRTHPMSDRVRGALFNVLGDISDLSVLDAFGGSGALSFEAISRGALRATVIESDRSAQRVIAENVETLGLSEKVKLVKASAGAWLSTNPDVQFDIVLCDPPYDDLQLNLLARLSSCVTSRGALVVSWPGKMDAPQFPGFILEAEHSYGDAQLFFFVRA
jgi:16S rRNA (guanine966-N2)-methyltransferase